MIKAAQLRLQTFPAIPTLYHTMENVWQLEEPSYAAVWENLETIISPELSGFLSQGFPFKHLQVTVSQYPSLSAFF